MDTQGHPTPADQRHPPHTKALLQDAVRYVVPTAISVVLIIVFLREVDMRQVWHIVRHGCNPWLIAAVMVSSLASVAIRGIRWGIQLRGVGIPRMPPGAEVSALFSAYALNLVFPRCGEAWRCIYVSRRQHSPLMTVVGTDIGDRTSDLICVFIFIGIVMLITPEQVLSFFHRYEFGRMLGSVLGHVWLWAGLAILIVATWVLLRYFRRWQWVQHLSRGLRNMADGFLILFHMPQTGLYLWLTLAMWVATYLVTYLGYFAFPFTAEWALSPGMDLGLKAGMVSLLFGVLSTAVPSNGGLGPWTIAVAYSLEIFGVDHSDATAYSFVIWGFQSISYVIAGIFAAIYMARHRPARSAATTHQALE